MALSPIKIYSKVYVGFQGRRTQDDVPLGYLTPYTEDQAGQSRRQSVDIWAKRGHGAYKTFNSVILDNKPMIGFKIGRSIRRSGGWNGSGASYVRIEDPRGFELEITIENLVMCMKDNLVHDGEIIAECVWGRDGNRNLLLPTNSQPYKDSVATTEKINNALSLRDVKPGDEVELVNGVTGIYYGGMYPIQFDKYSGGAKFTIGKRRHVLQYTGGCHPSNKGQLIGAPSIKVGRIIKAADKKMTPKEIEEAIGNAIKDSGKIAYEVCKDDSSSSWGARTYFWVVSDKIDITKAERKYIDETYIKNNADQLGNDGRCVIADNGVTLVDLRGRIDTNFVTRTTNTNRTYTLRNSRSWYHNYINAGDGIMGYAASIVDNREIIRGDMTHFDYTSDVKYFTLVNEIKTKAGTVITLEM